jgi:CheY-like chemotaxis protein
MGDRKRILVVDDSQTQAPTTEWLLKKQDYEVITALNSTEGFEKAKEEKPDVIIFDVIAPGGDGYKVGRQLRHDPETSEIPIIFLNAEQDTNSKEGSSAVGLQGINVAFECGASDFLQKPIAADDLVRSVKNVLWFSQILALA